MRNWSARGLLLGALLVGGAALAQEAPGAPPGECRECSTGRDPIGINEVSISEDTLTVDVVHGGGCALHTFGFEWDGRFQESNPVRASVLITHDAHGDPCKARVFKRLKFDLAQLKDQWRYQYKQEHGEVIIQFQGTDTNVHYPF